MVKLNTDHQLGLVDVCQHYDESLGSMEWLAEGVVGKLVNR